MSKCWYCNEELTTANYCDEHIGICTKCYGSMFQVSNEFVKGLMDKIADLEAKLAESEEKREELKQAISKCSSELPPNVAFDIANDDIRYQIVCNLTDRNQEHRNTIK